MIRISVLYPNHAGAHFDMHYYLEKHMPWAIELLSAHPAYKGVSVDRGLGDLTGGGNIPFVASCHFMFDSTEDFLAAFTPHAIKLKNDIPHYTNIEPIIETHEVVMLR